MAELSACWGRAQQVQGIFREYIERYRPMLTAKKHRPALGVYLETAKALAKVVQVLVTARAKLAEWAGAEVLRELVVTTFDRLPARLEPLGRPVTPLEAAHMAKQIYLEELQGRIMLLRQGRRPPSPEEGTRTPET